MKKKMTQAKSFITFDFPLDNQYLVSSFTDTHHRQQIAFPEWSLQATRTKIIARYWLEYVLIHFGTLLGTAIIATLPFSIHFNQYYLAAVFISGCISFVILTLWQYGPVFLSSFLPKLNAITSAFERIELERWQDACNKKLHDRFSEEYEKLAEQREDLIKQQNRLELLQKEIIKCRKAQLHTFSLVLIYYVFDKIGGLNALRCDDKSAALLTKLFGKDQGGIKDNLQLLLGKKQELSPRNRTEIQNRFNDVYALFEELQFVEGVQLLKNMEAKFVE